MTAFTHAHLSKRKSHKSMASTHEKEEKPGREDRVGGKRPPGAT